MSVRLDHIVISVQDLDRAIASYRAAGFTTLFGGKHADGLTHNALVLFADGSYLELLALVNPSGGVPLFKDLVLPHGEGYSGYALTCADLRSEAERMRGAGIEVGEIRQGGRMRADGVPLRWQMARLDDRMSPFIIQDETDRLLRVPAQGDWIRHANGATGIADVCILATDLEAEARRYAALTGSKATQLDGCVVFALEQGTLTITAPRTSADQGDAASGRGLPAHITLAGISTPILPQQTHGAAMHAPFSAAD
jgi:catechol 2,3-dioxygenase-like lactoylglutathione lyase family enzyme